MASNRSATSRSAKNRSASTGAFLVAAALILAASPARAGGYCAGLTLDCENGRSYPLCPIAVSIEGEIVTGRLGLGYGRGLHVRLVPMGAGYRYIGKGVWFDGVRSEAMLYFGPRHPIACTVLRQ
jgi:hypothetical protein